MSGGAKGGYSVMDTSTGRELPGRLSPHLLDLLHAGVVKFCAPVLVAPLDPTQRIGDWTTWEYTERRPGWDTRGARSVEIDLVDDDGRPWRP